MIKTAIGGISCVGKDYLFDKIREKIINKIIIPYNYIYYFHFSKNMKLQAKKENLEFKSENFENLANLVLKDIQNTNLNLIINAHYTIPEYYEGKIKSFRKDNIYNYGINNYILVETDPYNIQERREKKFNKKHSIDSIIYELNTERDRFYELGGKKENIVINDNIEESQKKIIKYNK